MRSSIRPATSSRQRHSGKASTTKATIPILAVLAFLASSAYGADAPQGAPDDMRRARLLALADELDAEGAAGEAGAVRAEAAGGAAAEERPAGDRATANRHRRGPGALLASAVVSFYRTFISSAIGARCALEPSCSQYFLEAGARHGLVGIPMIADRFVREPVESDSDRFVRRPDGTWRHSDPVSDHDWWF